MTNTELANTIASLKVQHLDCYHTYFTKMGIGSIVTGNRQREVLKATDLYLQVLEYYYNIPELKREDESPVHVGPELLLHGDPPGRSGLSAFRGGRDPEKNG